MKIYKLILTLLHGEKAQVLLGQLIFSGTSFLTNILIAKQAGMGQFGIYASVTLYAYLLLSISNSLIISPFQVCQDSAQNKKQYCGVLLLFQLVIIIIMLLVTVLVLQFSFQSLNPFRAYTTEIILLLGGFLLQDFFRKMFLAVHETGKALLTDVLSCMPQLVWLTANSFAAETSLQTSLFIIGITYMPAVIYGLYAMPSFLIRVTHVRQFIHVHIREGKWLLLTSLLQWWSNNFLATASAFLLGTTALGALRLAQTIFGMLNVFLQAFENYALPRAATLYKQSAENMKSFIKKISRYNFLFLLPVLLAVCIFSKQFFMFFGETNYVQYAGVLQGMSVLYLIIISGFPLRIAIRVHVMNKDFFAAYMLSFVFSLITYKFFIQQWKLAGVVMALGANQLLMLAYWQWKLKRKNFVLWK